MAEPEPEIPAELEAVVTESAPSPVAEPVPASPPAGPIVTTEPPAATPDALPLTAIKGLGPKVASMLAEHGITGIEQLAALTPDQAGALDIQLGIFTGRMARDRWIEQAKLLAAGDTAAYEAQFGKLG
jgi:predicted flap endonuclease-1-like 5' DNA nuclease